MREVSMKYYGPGSEEENKKYTWGEWKESGKGYATEYEANQQVDNVRQGVRSYYHERYFYQTKVGKTRSKVQKALFPQLPWAIYYRVKNVRRAGTPVPPETKRRTLPKARKRAKAQPRLTK